MSLKSPGFVDFLFNFFLLLKLDQLKTRFLLFYNLPVIGSLNHFALYRISLTLFKGFTTFNIIDVITCLNSQSILLQTICWFFHQGIDRGRS